MPAGGQCSAKRLHCHRIRPSATITNGFTPQALSSSIMSTESSHFPAVSDVSRDQGFYPMLPNQGTFFLRVGGGLIPAGGEKQPPIKRTRRPIGHRVNTDPDRRRYRPCPGCLKYCLATPGEADPSVTNPVSSTTQASGSMRSIALVARAFLTGSTSQGEVETNCWSR